jgi:polysaccharide pyruvyl transferase WcaK-like protein
MGISQADRAAGGTDRGELQGDNSLRARRTSREISGPQIVLLTPYNGGNFGDAAIQDTMIANIRLRLPGAQFLGICLNCDNFVERHGVGAFPLCGNNLPWYVTLRGRITDRPKYGERPVEKPIQKGLTVTRIKDSLKSMPVLGRRLYAIGTCWREIRHWALGYCFIRGKDLLIVSGGGQLNEQYGGPWGQPFALLKWAVMARVAQVPYVIASVGIGKVTSRTSRLFLTVALRLAQYRSYRDKNSRAFAASLLEIAAQDPIVPDLVFSLPPPELPRPAGVRAIASGRRIIGISPIAYAKPGAWPVQNRPLYDRYIRQMSRVVSQLLERDYFLVIVCSSLWDDESAISDLLGCLDDPAKKRLLYQTHIPASLTWKDFVASLLDVDCLIASRLHSVILGLVNLIPTVAVSFDSKVDWTMEDLGKTDYLLRIKDFGADTVLEALDRISLRRDAVVEQTGSYLCRVRTTLAVQYDTLAKFAAPIHRIR